MVKYWAPDIRLQMPQSIRENIARVQERIATACRRAGRSSQEVRLLAASKNVPPERIREAYEAGLRDFGENRVQEAGAKRPGLADLTATWHLIGHLQSNKAKAARELFHWVQSLDSFRLAERLHRAAPCSGDRLTVLLEVNLGAEPAKSGVRESEVLDLARRIGELESLELRGLMLVPPYFENPEETRPFFSRLRKLAKVVHSASLPNVRMDELSMGMSHDLETAIEEGATIVRVGTAIFGHRP
jgi:PLP dependent protein